MSIDILAGFLVPCIRAFVLVSPRSDFDQALVPSGSGILIQRSDNVSVDRERK